MHSRLVVVEPAGDLSLAPIAALRVAAGLAPDDDSRDLQLTSLGLRIAAEIADACKIAVGEGGEPTLRRELLRQTFRNADVEVLVLDRRHDVELTAVSIDGEDVADLTTIDVDVEAGMLVRWVAGHKARWHAREIIIEYRAGFDEVPAVLAGAVADVARVRLSEAAHDPLDKAVTIEIPDVETVRRDRWLGALPGASSTANGGLPADIVARLGRFMNQWMG